MTQNLILDFNHIYDRHDPLTWPFTYLDLSRLPETNMYCSDQAKKAITRLLSIFPIQGIHFLDNGNYHYLTYFFVMKIQKPFNLIVFDHHTDMQDALFEDMLSCGNWIKEVLKAQPHLHQLILIGPEKKAFDTMDLHHKCISITYENLLAKDLEMLNSIDPLPSYISIDKDVLSDHYALTNWNQGKMSLPTLEKLLAIAFVDHPIIGLDICGEADLSMPLPLLEEAHTINEKTDASLLQFIKTWMQFKKIERIP